MRRMSCLFALKSRSPNSRRQNDPACSLAIAAFQVDPALLLLAVLL